MASPAWVAKALARRASEREDMIETARRFARALPGSLGVLAVVVFGSAARGDFNAWSDIDVLVIAENLPARSQDRLGVLLQFSPPGVQPLGWTAEEFRAQLAGANPIAVEALARGVPLSGARRLHALRAE